MAEDSVWLYLIWIEHQWYLVSTANNYKTTQEKTGQKSGQAMDEIGQVSKWLTILQANIERIKDNKSINKHNAWLTVYLAVSLVMTGEHCTISRHTYLPHGSWGYCHTIEKPQRNHEHWKKTEKYPNAIAPPGVLVGVIIFQSGELDQREKQCYL